MANLRTAMDSAFWDQPISSPRTLEGSAGSMPDLSSLVSESGFRYRFGIHKSNGHPKAINAVNDQPPLALMPGLCGGFLFLREEKDLWRKKQTKKDVMVKADKGWILGPSNDARLSEPHAAISGSIGGSCAACFGGRGNSASADGDISTSTRSRGPSSADLFGSVCCTFQHGKFTKRYGDLTRVDARLDIYSAFAVTKRAFNIFRSSVAGPIVFRVDSRFSLDSASGQLGPHAEDLIYTFELLAETPTLWQGCFLVFYKMKEQMIKLRLFGF
ncbi:hypothetical protein GH714_039398 [Hevea brasiliensis]|uniref:Uncharacterized protein n=1 Tax=Hevea brasiliensis TaxID=3981 RepID=A0A6A6MKI2_HEVBR|nr:hypothetical protein GH714_039398 [Hevea brasiliensis]